MANAPKITLKKVILHIGRSRGQLQGLPEDGAGPRFQVTLVTNVIIYDN